MGLSTMETFLPGIKRFITHDKDKANFLAMHEGKYYVPKKHAAKIWDYYARCGAKLPMGCSLIPKCQGRIGPMAIDLDFTLERPPGPQMGQITAFTREVAEQLEAYTGEPIVLVVTKKDTGYPKTVKGKNCYQAGLHVICAKTKGGFTTGECIEFRETNLGLIKKHFGDLDLAVEPSKVWDAGVAKRDQFPMIIGSSKPTSRGDTGGRASIRLILQRDSGVDKTAVGPGLAAMLSKEMPNILKTMYAGVWGEVEQPPVRNVKRSLGDLNLAECAFSDEPKKKKTKPESKPTRTVLRNKDGFSLEGFITETANFTWEYTEWIRWVGYFAAMGLDPEKTEKEINRAWNWTEPEIADMMRRQQRDFSPKKAPKQHDMAKLLVDRVPTAVPSRVWCAVSWTTYNGFRQFAIPCPHTSR